MKIITKNKTVKVLVLLIGLGIASNVPVFGGLDMTWVKSHETTAFMTDDGDIATDEYAIIDDDYLIRDCPKDECHFKRVDSNYDISGLDKVEINTTTNAYYNFFRDSGENLVREPADQEEYESLFTVKDYPQPDKQEQYGFWKMILPAKADDIAFDAVANDIDVNVTTYSFSHTTGSGDNRALVVAIGLHESTDSDRECTSITYNSDPMTELNEFKNDPNNHTVCQYYMINPDSGSNTVAVILVGNNARVVSGSVSLTGVNQTDTLAGSNSGEFTNANKTTNIDVVTEADDVWITDAAMGSNSSDFDDIVASGSQVERVDILIHSGVDIVFGISTLDFVSEGTATMEWTEADDTGDTMKWSHVALGMRPATTSAVDVERRYIREIIQFN